VSTVRRFGEWTLTEGDGYPTLTRPTLSVFTDNEPPPGPFDDAVLGGDYGYNQYGQWVPVWRERENGSVSILQPAQQVTVPKEAAEALREAADRWRRACRNAYILKAYC
jgi:hypothetical protein